MATIDDDLAKAVTEGFRQARIDISNQDKLLTGPDDVEVELANGQKKTGPSWPKIAKLANDADLTAFTAVAGQVRADAQQVANDKTAAGASKDAAKTSETNSKTSETNSASRAAAALASQNASKTSETNSAASAASAKADADRAQLANPDNWESAPFPDVWIPFNDSLQMLAGNGPYDRINIGSDYLELPSRSATFTRASTATYIDKSGVLQTAAINEPRFEKEGLLIEGQSTNLFLYSENFLGTLPGGKFDIYNSNLTGVKNTDGSTTFSNNAASPNTSGNGARRMLISSAMTIAANTQHTLSFMGKGGTHQVTIYGTGAPTNTTFEVVFPEDRFGIASFTFTSTAAGGVFQCEIYANPKNADHAAYNGNFSLRYFQIEALPFATSYIPTNGAAATRARDNWSVPNSGNVPTDNKVSLALEFDSALAETTDRDYRCILMIDGGRYIYFNPPNGAVNALAGEISGIPGFQLSAGNSVKKGRNLLALSCDGTKTNSLMNAGQILSNPNNIFGPIDLYLSGAIKQDTSTIRCINGHIRNLRIWHRALTDAQLRSLR